MKYELGARIRYYRERRGINQKDFANIIGVSNSRLSNWEQGINRPDADLLPAICIGLQISADELLDIKQSECEDWDVSVAATDTPEGAAERIKMFEALSPDAQERVIEYMRFEANKGSRQ